MDNALALVNETKQMKPSLGRRLWRECPVMDDVIFEATDDCGRAGWFLRLTVSGLYPRRVGPYLTKEQAINVWEAFITEVELGLFLDLMNELDPTQAYVVEGVPQLVGSSTEPIQEGV